MAKTSNRGTPWSISIKDSGAPEEVITSVIIRKSETRTMRKTCILELAANAVMRCCAVSALIPLGLFLGVGRLQGQTTQPIVAIHDSEWTRSLQTQPATGSTPTGSGTTGFQWWNTDWNYFVMPESAEETFRSDGTAFTVVGDADIAANALLTNGVPAYP